MVEAQQALLKDFTAGSYLVLATRKGIVKKTRFEEYNTPLKADGMRITPEAHPERGLFYRSDHFPFSKVGAPAFVRGLINMRGTIITVLDLGAGTGKLSRLLVETGARVVAVEPVEEMIQQRARADAREPRGHLQRGRARRGHERARGAAAHAGTSAGSGTKSSGPPPVTNRPRGR